MKINKITASVLVVFVLAIAALAAWGEHLGMNAGALRWVQGAAGAIGVLVFAMLPRLFDDKNGDGIPDIVEKLMILGFVGTAMTVAGCGASAAQTVPLVIGGAEIVVTGVCSAAEKLCEANDPQCGSGACHAFHVGCGSLPISVPVQIACDAPPVVLDAGVPSSPTSPAPQARMSDQVLDRRPLRDHARVRM